MIAAILPLLITLNNNQYQTQQFGKARTTSPYTPEASSPYMPKTTSPYMPFSNTTCCVPVCNSNLYCNIPFPTPDAIGVISCNIGR